MLDMPETRRFVPSVMMLVVLTMMLFAADARLSAQETVLQSFNNNDGSEPIASLISDAAGNLYGTTFYGGANGVGTVYELKRNPNGHWSEKVLHSFNIDGSDGYFTTASLAFDSSGNLYGTTFFGGATDDGVVYELSPGTGGIWTEKILHSFLNDSGDGGFPRSGVILDAQGDLYGTTPNGGPNNYGTVYELIPAGDGSWTENVLYLFGNTDGATPFGSLVLDSKGNLYGTTSAGGGSSAICQYGCGGVFELKKNADGSWSEKLLHNFTTNSKDGMFPYGPLILDKAGNLYGTTSQGGAGNNGTVFEMTRAGGWREKLLYAFKGGSDGVNPAPGMVFDAAGNLYGATLSGGAMGQGTIFELMAGTGGSWTETILYSFDPSGGGGYDPAQGPTIDASGNIYGTAISGGAFANGTAFQITP
jgi:uncharacterized repeat protein (TIGR03803 family)